MTGVERRLWSYLRRRQVAGYKFRRQVPIGPYVADFACLSARLIVEVDGPGHDPVHDAHRDNWFLAEGYRVLRVSAESVFWEIPDVIDTIHHSLPGPLRRCAPPPRRSGEESIET
jgi:very-short-patch-repair endonuclease